MSDVVHHSDAEDGVIPKRFTCRRKMKQGTWTRYPWIVDCPQCLAVLKGKPNASVNRLDRRTS